MDWSEDSIRSVLSNIYQGLGIQPSPEEYQSVLRNVREITEHILENQPDVPVNVFQGQYFQTPSPLHQTTNSPSQDLMRQLGAIGGMFRARTEESEESEESEEDQ